MFVPNKFVANMFGKSHARPRMTAYAPGMPTTHALMTWAWMPARVSRPRSERPVLA